MDVYLRGKRIKLDPTRSLGKGGEADVFDLGGGRALKLFKSPDHPDYQGLPRRTESGGAAHRPPPEQAARVSRGTTAASGRARRARDRSLGPLDRRLRDAGRRPGRAPSSVWRSELQARRCRQPRRRQAVSRDSHRRVRPPRRRGGDRRLQRPERPGDHGRAAAVHRRGQLSVRSVPVLRVHRALRGPAALRSPGRHPSPGPPLQRRAPTGTPSRPS